MAGTFTTSTGDERKVILKIDTTTGETWVYQYLCLDVTPTFTAIVEGWGNIRTDADTAWADLLKKFPNAKLTGPSKPVPSKSAASKP